MEAMLAQFEKDAGNIKVGGDGGGNGGGNQQQQQQQQQAPTQQERQEYNDWLAANGFSAPNNKGVLLSDYTEEEIVEAARQASGYYDQQP